MSVSTAIKSFQLGMPTFYVLRKAIRPGTPTQVPARPGVVGDLGMCGRSLFGNREISWSASDSRFAPNCRACRTGPCREGEEPKPMMHDREKSDPVIVAVKLTNKAGRPAAESVEPRAGAEGNVNQQSTGRAQYRETVSQA